MPSVRVAVFPAAGLGTPFLPATKAQPRRCCRWWTGPLVQYVVEEARAARLERIVIVTGRGKNAIEDHFDTSFELERMLERGQEPTLLEAGARDLGSRPDLLRPPEVRARPGARRPPGPGPRRQRALRGHARRRHRGRAGALHRPDDAGLRAAGKPRHRSPGGPARADPPLRDRRSAPGRRRTARVVAITDMVEEAGARQDAPSNLAIIGRYLLPPEIFEILAATASDVGGEIQLTSALKTLLQRQPIDGYLFEGRRYDAGDKLGFLRGDGRVRLEARGPGRVLPELPEDPQTLIVSDELRLLSRIAFIELRSSLRSRSHFVRRPAGFGRPPSRLGGLRLRGLRLRRGLRRIPDLPALVPRA